MHQGNGTMALAEWAHTHEPMRMEPEVKLYTQTQASACYNLENKKIH